MSHPRRNGKMVIDPARVDRLPPHSIESEQGVLGCALLDPAEIVPTLVTRLGDSGEVFYDLRHRTIYEALVSMWSFRVPIDMISLQSQLRDNKQLEEVGGLAYLSSLPDQVPSSANLEYYLSDVLEKHDCRKIIAGCTDIVCRVFEDPGEVEKHIESFEQFAMTVRRQNISHVKDGKAQARICIDRLESAKKSAETGAVFGVTTGFYDLDKETGGALPGEYWVIAGSPSAGKTSLAMNIAENISQKSKSPVGVFSLEMSAEQLSLRMACSAAEVNLRTARTGLEEDGSTIIEDATLTKLANAVVKMAKAPLYIDDESGISVLQLRAKARRMVQHYGCKVFVVDYLTLLSSGLPGKPDVYRDTSFISNQLKAMAKELNVILIVLSQVGRGASKENRKLTIHDVRNSGSIEADADTMLLLNADPAAIEASPDCYEVECEIGKQRNGRRHITIPLTFFAKYCKFKNSTKGTGTP